MKKDELIMGDKSGFPIEKTPDRAPDIELVPTCDWIGVRVWVAENVVEMKHLGVIRNRAPIAAYRWQHDNGMVSPIKNLRHLFRLILDEENVPQSWSSEIALFLAEQELLGE